MRWTVGSASIAVYRFEARVIDGESDGKIGASRSKVSVFRMIASAEDD
jgi:hypothetical protein